MVQAGIQTKQNRFAATMDNQALAAELPTPLVVPTAAVSTNTSAGPPMAGNVARLRDQYLLPGTATMSSAPVSAAERSTEAAATTSKAARPRCRARKRAYYRGLNAGFGAPGLNCCSPTPPPPPPVTVEKYESPLPTAVTVSPTSSRNVADAVDAPPATLLGNSCLVFDISDPDPDPMLLGAAMDPELLDWMT